MTGSATNDGRPHWNPWRMAAWGIAAGLLLLPLIAMQFTHEVAWSPADFAVAGALIVGSGLLYELAVRTTRNRAYRAAVAIALATAIFLVWSNLAVGIIGSEKNPANLMFFAVPAIALVGSLVARFRPQGMVIAFAATAAAQVSLAVTALLLGMHLPVPITAFFTAMWLASAALFQRAARSTAA